MKCNFFLKQLLSEIDQCRGYLKGGNSNIVLEGTEKNTLFQLYVLFGDEDSVIFMVVRWGWIKH